MPKEKPLCRKVAFVTGGSGGIGKAIALRFLAEGACVVLSDIDEKALAATKAEFDSSFGKDLTVTAPADVPSAEKVATTLKVSTRPYGVDCFVGNWPGWRLSKPLDQTNK